MPDPASDESPPEASGPSPQDGRFDAVIVGSGAGGGTMAWSLARAGFSVLVLEKGPRFERHHYRHDGGLTPGAFIPSPEVDPHAVVTRTTRDPVRSHLGWTAVCVGGGTVHMGAYFYRFHPDDFRMQSRFGPGGDDFYLADWPFSYTELGPYYARAEALIGVAGRAGLHPFDG
ncbi:MAG: FAD-dependent oxidoreductase, partial [Holophagales bacterium]|nr:FAD-dependent oxidoreductase [Holophagales bacterium]